MFQQCPPISGFFVLFFVSAMWRDERPIDFESRMANFVSIYNELDICKARSQLADLGWVSLGQMDRILALSRCGAKSTGSLDDDTEVNYGTLGASHLESAHEIRTNRGLSGCFPIKC